MQSFEGRTPLLHKIGVVVGSLSLMIGGFVYATQQAIPGVAPQALIKASIDHPIRWSTLETGCQIQGARKGAKLG
ncbi:hypothetical protein ASPBRDRAFT_204706 [Aspergillus brasiliensis CBS 101740]|uniref:Uncharacterized protein n=1 Tax=Aspergillus brasiliensis (strain CBS 101740 / IMI 381727 / IBT 21946) TaxID=767769 RepID=A0A1L9US44_ASPBC|nr:hypothetical protein ASPBRDRAFT_204706 [Aspergillus brasiliensis CBS 101740]